MKATAVLRAYKVAIQLRETARQMGQRAHYRRRRRQERCFRAYLEKKLEEAE